MQQRSRWGKRPICPVFRLVTQPPQRLSLDTLAALCDVLACTPNELIEIDVVNTQVTKTVGDVTGDDPLHRKHLAPRSAAPTAHEQRQPSPRTSACHPGAGGCMDCHCGARHRNGRCPLPGVHVAVTRNPTDMPLTWDKARQILAGWVVSRHVCLSFALCDACRPGMHSSPSEVRCLPRRGQLRRWSVRSSGCVLPR